MYTLRCDGQVIHGHGMKDAVVDSPVLNTAIEEVGMLTFDMPPSHPFYNKIIETKSIVVVYSDKDVELWRGRVIDTGNDSDTIKPIKVEGPIAFLNDGVVRPYDLVNVTWKNYIQAIINDYNSRVDTFKRIGRINVTMPAPKEDGELISDWMSETYKTARTSLDELRSTYGGHQYVSYENGVYVFNYIEKYSNVASQKINFGGNLISVERNFTGANFASIVIPIGKDGITIKDVNAGKDYLINSTIATKHGKVERICEHPEIDDEDELLIEGQKNLEKYSNGGVTIKATAIDLNAVDSDIDAFRVGDLVRVTSPPHNIDEELQVNAIKLDMLNPEQSEITIGDKVETLTERSI